jgi:outer membrane protein TolC
MKLASIRRGSLLRLAPGIELYPTEEAPVLLELVPPTSKESDLLAEALETRPEIRQAREELAAGRYEETGATWGPLIPSLQADTGLGVLGPVPSDLYSTRDYAVTLGWRIGPGGLFDSGRQNLSEARARQAAINLERVRQKVADEVLSSLAQLRAKEEQRKLAQQAVRDAEEALALNQQRQSQNIGIPLKVLQAEEALTRAKLELDGAMIECNQSQLRAFSAAGRRHGHSK